MGYDTSALGGAFGVVGILISIALTVFYIAVIWKIYAKAGQPGWAAIVPIYNLVVYLKIVNRPVWWLLLLIIPGVNIVIAILLVVDLARSFGKSDGFAVGMIFLSFIFYPILAFGDATYTPIPRSAE